MIIVAGLASVLIGYAMGLWAYCLIRGYCVTPANIMNWNFPSQVQGGSLSASSKKTA